MLEDVQSVETMLHMVIRTAEFVLLFHARRSAAGQRARGGGHGAGAHGLSASCLHFVSTMSKYLPGGLPPDSVCEEEPEVLEDMQRLIDEFHDNSKCVQRK